MKSKFFKPGNWLLIWLLAFAGILFSLPALAYFPGESVSKADTAKIKADIDIARNLVDKNDSTVVLLLNDIITQSKVIKYVNGEADALYTLGKYYKKNEQPAKAIEKYNAAYLILKNAGDKPGMIKCLNQIGITRLQSGEYEVSLDYFRQVLDLAVETGNKKKMSDAYLNMGIAYDNLGNYPKALQYYLKCLNVDQEIQYVEAIPDDFSSVAMIYGKMGDDSSAVKYHQMAVEYSRKHKNYHALLSSLVNLGIRLKQMGRLNEAENAFNESLTLIDRVNDNTLTSGVYHNIGAFYNKKKNYSLALKYFAKSMAVKNVADEHRLLIANYAEMAVSYRALGQYSKATDYAKQSLMLAQKINLMEKMEEASLLLSNIFQDEKDYEHALFYYKLHNSYKDSLFTVEKNRQLKELQTKYETEKKEREIVSLSRDKQLQDIRLKHKSTIQFITVASFIILILFAMGIFRNHQLKQEGKRKLLAEQLKHEQIEADRLKEQDQLKSRFFANVAHEFRTPLTLILGPLENLITETKAFRIKNQLILVKKNASRLIQLVNQLLDLSKLEAKAVKINLVTDDVMLFLKNHTFAFESLAEQQKIKLSFHSEISSLNMAFDKDKLEKVLFNLLSNAIKFTPASGSVKVYVDLIDAEPGIDFDQLLKIRVSDSGPGIPEEDLPLVFNRFYQSDRVISRTTQGSGIGLELAKELIEICGGQIDVINNPDHGAQFRFTVLVRKSGETADNSQTTAKVSQAMYDSVIETLPSQTFSSYPDETGKEIILVVEDNADVRNFIVSSLTSAYQVVEATDGADGVRKALKFIPDLILSDVMMPEKDGFQVCMELKSDEKTSHVPFILLTSKADVESRIEGLQLGADDYLAKPFNTKELLVRIKNLIDQRRKLREKYLSQTTEASKVKILPTKEQVFMKKLRDTIEIHLAEEEYSVDELSREMAMDRTQLFRKVKALTNGSVSMYIRLVRLEHAYRLLSEGMYNVSEVAYRVGFNSSTYFSTCFTEQYGFPPSDLRTEKVQI